MKNQPNIRQDYRTVKMVRPNFKPAVAPKKGPTAQTLPKIKWWFLAIIAAVPVICLVASYLKGRAAFQGCVWATILSIIAGAVSLLPILYLIKSKSATLTGCVLASSAIRVFVILFGVLICIFMIKITTRWFPAWVAFFYLLMLSVDVWLILRKQEA
jgi:hypothetical protein